MKEIHKNGEKKENDRFFEIQNIISICKVLYLCIRAPKSLNVQELVLYN